MNGRNRTIVLAASLMLLSASGLASAQSPITPDHVEGPWVWGEADNVTRLRHLYFAAQPDAAGLAAAQAAGIVAVIDLRDPSERDWNERSAVEALGMRYDNVPVSGKRFTPEAIHAIEAIVAENGQQPILIYCSSSNRAGGWLATHLVSQHGMSVDDALAVGRRAGIKKPGVEQSVRAYVAEEAAAERARDALVPFKNRLKSTLGAAMREQGPTGAMDACRLAAPALAAEASRNGVTVGRTSHALRNPANAPAVWMEPLLSELKASASRPAASRTVSLGDGRYGYVEPIYVQTLCLACHGANISPPVGEALSESYPEDRAIDFVEGDFRGLFWVEVDAEIRQ